MHSLADTADRFVPNPAFAPHLAHRAPPAGQWPPPWASAWGDDRHGLWAELEVSGSYAAACQRLRWIEPGTFLMGSPADEQERLDGEGPRHSVTLTEGYWLADTLCTQELWLAAVDGTNPSHFFHSNRGRNLPVESVSWDDVMERFMPGLQSMLPEGCKATLPSEAQWEYACRAGTSTAYAWGDEADESRANMGATQRTSDVRTYPANAWGLHDMHGNVFEWCLDEMRPYEERAEVDPVGAAGGGPCVLRGGAWCDRAGYARSAFRLRGVRGYRRRNFGFRLALRFKPSPEAGGPGA
jgi:sulfatase modifying factor 1